MGIEQNSSAWDMLPFSELLLLILDIYLFSKEANRTFQGYYNKALRNQRFILGVVSLLSDGRSVAGIGPVISGS
jgi:hypothetical protein